MLRKGALAIACGWLAVSSSALAADLTLQIRDGRVTLDARDVPVGEILAEWTRVGQTTIVGADTMAGPPVTLQIVDRSESEALDLILRSCSGYAATARAAGSAGASVFERILILATSNRPADAAGSVAGNGQPLGNDVGSPRPAAAAAPANPQLAQGIRNVRAQPPVVVQPDTDEPEAPPPPSAIPFFPPGATSRIPGVVPSPPQKPAEPRPPGPPRS